jgi:hypothetical protein
MKLMSVAIMALGCLNLIVAVSPLSFRRRYLRSHEPSARTARYLNWTTAGQVSWGVAMIGLGAGIFFTVDAPSISFWCLIGGVAFVVVAIATYIYAGPVPYSDPHDASARRR